MRVRSGRFTQEDPIGIAGGLNLYGFGGGDPVTYSDPYGLCPEHLVQADGNCPGGMSHGAYDRLEYMTNTKMSAEAATPLLGMLESGRLVANEGMQGTETRVQAVHYADERPTYLRIGPDFWAEGSDAAAFTLAHDYGHVIQKERLGLIYDSSSTMSLTQWNLLTATPNDGGPGLAFFEATQADANRFACSVTISQTGYHERYCE